MHGWRGSGCGPATTRSAKRRSTTSTRPILDTDDLVEGNNYAATGITDGELLKGAHYDLSGASTQSLVMRSRSGTATTDAYHNLQ